MIRLATLHRMGGLARLSLRGRLVLASILVEVVMLGLLVGNSLRLNQNHLAHQAQERIQALELAYKTALAPAMASRDYATLRDILDGWRKSDEVLYLMVTDPHGRVLATSGWPADQPPPPLSREIGAPVWHVGFGVDYLGQVYGEVRYGLSMAFMEKARRELFLQSGLIAAAEVLLTLLLLSTLGYWLTRHLRALTEASDRIAQGDYRIRLETGSGDEVARLALNFNAMAGAIEARIAALSRGEERFRAIADYTYDWENWHSPDGELLWINPAVERVTGYGVEECRALPDFPLSLVYGDDVELVRRCHEQGLAGRTGQDQEFRIRRKDGRIVWVGMSWQPIFNGAGQPLGYRSSIRDISLEHIAREELAYQANHDALTGLYNRRAFENLLREVLTGLGRGGEPHALLYIDLDQFKLVNDTCGHSAGDTLLQEIAAIMRRNAGTGQLARLGGDEFGLLLPGGVDEAVRLGEKLIDRLRGYTFTVEGHVFHVGASIGVVAITSAEQDIDTLLIAADQACYAAKDRGRDRLEVFALEDDYYRNMRAQLLSAAQLAQALREDRFRLHYQRIEPLRPGLPAHREILIRLADGQGNLVPPGEFIPAAERFNLMPRLDRWVFEQVCRMAAPRPGDTEVLGVNLSGATLSEDGLAEFVMATLERHGVDPRRVCFEITETAAIGNMDQARRFIDAVKGLGVSVALDDFGAGLSSFAYLRQLPVDYLKIDGQFVRGMHRDERDQAVVRAIIEVARVHGMQVIAEYVHAPEIMDMLRRMGVDYAQGYAIHKPEPWV